MWPVWRECRTVLGAGASDESITRSSIDSTKMRTCSLQRGREWTHCRVARLMNRGRTSACVGHDKSTVSHQQWSPWRKAAAPVVAKNIEGKYVKYALIHVFLFFFTFFFLFLWRKEGRGNPLKTSF